MPYLGAWPHRLWIGNSCVRRPPLRRTIALPGRAQSRAEFAAKRSIVVEEADEALYWLELLRESGLVKPERLVDLIREADELVAITFASRRTAKSEPAQR